MKTGKEKLPKTHHHIQPYCPSHTPLYLLPLPNPPYTHTHIKPLFMTPSYLSTVAHYAQFRLMSSCKSYFYLFTCALVALCSICKKHANKYGIIVLSGRRFVVRFNRITHTCSGTRRQNTSMSALCYFLAVCFMVTLCFR